MAELLLKFVVSFQSPSGGSISPTSEVGAAVEASPPLQQGTSIGSTEEGTTTYLNRRIGVATEELHRGMTPKKQREMESLELTPSEKVVVALVTNQEEGGNPSMQGKWVNPPQPLEANQKSLEAAHRRLARVQSKWVNPPQPPDRNSGPVGRRTRADSTTSSPDFQTLLLIEESIESETLHLEMGLGYFEEEKRGDFCVEQGRGRKGAEKEEEEDLLSLRRDVEQGRGRKGAEREEEESLHGSEQEEEEEEDETLDSEMEPSYVGEEDKGDFGMEQGRGRKETKEETLAAPLKSFSESVLERSFTNVGLKAEIRAEVKMMKSAGLTWLMELTQRVGNGLIRPAHTNPPT